MKKKKIECTKIIHLIDPTITKGELRTVDSSGVMQVCKIGVAKNVLFVNNKLKKLIIFKKMKKN